MAEIKPFRALRYTKKAGEIQNLVCPPYDIICPAEREALFQKDEHNAIRLELPAGKTPYTDAAHTLQNWLKEGILKQDTQPALYLYEEEFTVRGERLKNKGILCLVKLEDFKSGKILPHEETLLEAKQDRLSLLKETGCSFSPVYALYEDPKKESRERMERLTSVTPRYEFSNGEVTHRLWVVNDILAIRAFQEDFLERRLWIADGHHRYETALNYQKYCRKNGLSKEGKDPDYGFLFLADADSSGLAILPLHRLVRDIKGFDPAAVLESCRSLFDIYEMPEPNNIETNMDALFRQSQKAFAFYTGGKTWWLMRLKGNAPSPDFMPEKSEVYRNLDVTLLHGLILEPLLHITPKSMAAQQNLTYTRSFSEAISSVQSGEQQCAFFVNPARIQEIQRIAEQGEKMPQKSTYFYPKLTTGLLFRQAELAGKTGGTDR